MQIDFIFSILILIFSVVVHEVSHGYVAFLQGDNTAKFAGRLTLNPLKHLEWFGSFLLPLMSYFFGGFIIGWAKPVPFNPYNLRNQKWGEALVAVAGPLSNICLALFFGLLIRFGFAYSFGEQYAKYPGISRTKRSLYPNLFHFLSLALSFTTCFLGIYANNWSNGLVCNIANYILE